MAERQTIKLVREGYITEVEVPLIETSTAADALLPPSLRSGRALVSCPLSGPAYGASRYARRLKFPYVLAIPFSQPRNLPTLHSVPGSTRTVTRLRNKQQPSKTFEGHGHVEGEQH